MIYGSQHHVGAYQRSVTDIDAALVLKVAAAVYEYILSHANILPALGVERREYAESGLDFLPNEF